MTFSIAVRRKFCVWTIRVNPISFAKVSSREDSVEAGNMDAPTHGIGGKKRKTERKK